MSLNIKWLRVEDVMAELNICKSTAYKLIRKPNFPKLKVGKSILIPVADFEAWIQNEIDKQKNLGGNNGAR